MPAAGRDVSGAMDERLREADGLWRDNRVGAGRRPGVSGSGGSGAVRQRLLSCEPF